MVKSACLPVDESNIEPEDRERPEDSQNHDADLDGQRHSNCPTPPQKEYVGPRLKGASVRYTEDERDYISRYAQWALAANPTLTRADLAAGLAKQIPRHTENAWRHYIDRHKELLGSAAGVILQNGRARNSGGSSHNPHRTDGHDQEESDSGKPEISPLYDRQKLAAYSTYAQTTYNSSESDDESEGLYWPPRQRHHCEASSTTVIPFDHAIAAEVEKVDSSSADDSRLKRRRSSTRDQQVQPEFGEPECKRLRSSNPESEAADDEVSDPSTWFLWAKMDCDRQRAVK
ncbi:hypothetical protein K474DRAFT_851646 [Panus rudis PR-1116 ss-1]|nr:hypothetical protein K474DRAFT_851646 [Panus rudis PR-1116 ss-1]